MANINGLPVFEALVDSEDTGMLRISLVDDPAVMSDFLAFAGEQRKVQRYAIADEDRHLVFGVVMRADFPIYRYDEGYGDLMHDGHDVQGVEMVQAFLKDTAKGVAPAGFEDIADGSLFAEFHIEDEDIWAQVKDGTFKGFSLEGIFEMRPEQDQRQVDDIVSKTDNFTNQKNMSKINKIKAMLAKMLASLASVTTDKGVLEWDGEEDLKAGDAVFVVNQEGEREAAADGDYITDDGKKIVVVDGKVAEIVDQEAEVAPEPEAEEAPVEMASKATDKGELFWEGDEDLKAGDEVFVETDGERQPAPDGEYATEDGKVIVVVDGKVAEIKDAEAEVAPAEEPSEEVAELRRQVAALKKELAELKAKPMAQPAHEEVKASSVPGKTGIKGLDRLAAIMSAK